MPIKEATDCPDDSFDIRNATEIGPGCHAKQTDIFGTVYCNRTMGHDEDHHAHTIKDDKILCVKIWKNNE